MIDGGLPSSTPRRSENAASSAVSGLPDWNFSPDRILNTTCRPSAEASQPSAAPRNIFPKPLPPGPDLDPPLPAVGRSLPTLGGTRDDLPEIARVVLHQPQVEVVQRVAGGNLERLL